MKKLLMKLRNQIKGKDELYSGLCLEINLMRKNTIISTGECFNMLAYIQDHRPKRGKHFDPECVGSDWFWESGLVAPRLAWLNDIINNFHNNR